jgi:hypothetical protein
MRDDEPDYDAYGLPDLLDAARHIDRDRFAERAAWLDEAIRSRHFI